MKLTTADLDRIEEDWDLVPSWAPEFHALIEAARLQVAWDEAAPWHPNIWPTHLVDGSVAYWTATVTRPGPCDGYAFTGPTPAAALRALTAELSLRKDTGV